jgi:predicted Fe-S protein YdhL (DUF1289 family)
VLTESPCIGVCLINKDHHFCEGCFRSQDEIAQWIALDETQKKEIVELASERQIKFISF